METAECIDQLSTMHIFVILKSLKYESPFCCGALFEGTSALLCAGSVIKDLGE